MNKVEEARQALNNVFADTTVSKEQTKKDLEDLAEEITILLSGL